MSEPKSNDLPRGVTLVCRDGNEPVELTIRAADGNELAWRIHDLIPLIQSGKLGKLIDAARQTNKPS